MNKQITKIIDQLLDKSDQKATLLVLEQLFNRGIPFNSPHKFKFVELSDSETRLKIPFKRVNKNHLGGIHACAIATIGEYTAGLTLIKHVGSSKYRLIMKSLEAQYIKQAREAVFAQVIVDKEYLHEAEQNLLENDQVDISFSTNILNQNEEVIAVVQTIWQLKNWKKVSFK